MKRLALMDRLNLRRGLELAYNLWAAQCNHLARRMSREKPKSIYFFTIHKAASTLFSEYVLKVVRNRKHVDYASRIYRGGHDQMEIAFKPTGHIYGPIRLVPGGNDLEYRLLIAPATSPGFLADKNVVCLIRDPRDVLISEYFSFGFTHGFSRNPEIRRLQLARRDAIRNQKLDEYVLANVRVAKVKLEAIRAIAASAEKSIILKYETLITDFGEFAKSLQLHLDLSDRVLRRIYRRTRPRQKENPGSHRRSGISGEYRTRLNPSTIETINAILAPELSHLGYRME